GVEIVVTIVHTPGGLRLSGYPRAAGEDEGLVARDAGGREARLRASRAVPGPTGFSVRGARPAAALRRAASAARSRSRRARTPGGSACRRPCPRSPPGRRRAARRR